MSSRRINSEKARLWQARIKQQKASGLPINRFCYEQGWNSHTFKYWKKKCSESSSLVSSKKFVPVHVSNPVRDSRVRSRIELPNGVVVELGNDLGEGGISTLIKTLCGVNPASERRST